MSWSAVISGFRSHLLLERSLSGNTIDAYVSDLNKLVSWLEISQQALQPADITTDQLSQFIQWLNELGLGARSQARLLSALKTFYKYLQIEQITGFDPTELLDGPRLPRHIPEVLSIHEIQRMLEVVDLSTPHGVRNRAILETLYACGLRVSELTELRLSGLYMDIGFVKVTGKGNKERIVPIGEEAMKHIRLYLDGVRQGMLHIDKDHSNYLFLNRRGKKLSRVMVFMMVKEMAALSGIQKNVSPHTFRHSFASHLIEGGADLKAVQDMLGHESILTTEIYTHLDTAYLRETILQYHPRNKSGRNNP
jgi:integrase/recombinase XerD